MAIEHPGEPRSNEVRRLIAEREPKGLRTYTPTQLVIAKSAGVFHWTPDGRKLYDFTSGVLVANLGHNPSDWHKRFLRYMGWADRPAGGATFEAVPLTAYNAVTQVEAEAVRRLTACLQARPGGRRLEQVLWAASGSEAVQKALWAALAFDPSRDRILATRDGFHGKKGLAEATTGNERSPERDPRVRFVSFPKQECIDVTTRGDGFDPDLYRAELDALWRQYGPRLTALITEPYLGAAGSFHPPPEYLQLLVRFCREHDIGFILDEIQSNFGRTGKLFAFETYGIEPDIVVLGKGLGNGVPVAAAVGPAAVLESLDYGQASDTYSANPLASAAVLATLDEYESEPVIERAAEASKALKAALLRLKELPFVRHVRGEGMVWGIEIGPHGRLSANEMAIACVRKCYEGEPGGDGVHLLGPLAGCVIRISPPLTISPEEVHRAFDLMYRLLAQLADEARAS